MLGAAVTFSIQTLDAVRKSAWPASWTSIYLVRVTIEEREQVTNVTSAFPANGRPASALYGRSVLVAMGLMIIFGSAIAVGLYFVPIAT